MRTLILMRGAPGSGKSTFLKQNKLEDYTLSADAIRLLHQSPILKENGLYGIAQNNDRSVWILLLELLEKRMSRGELTVIDACHSKSSDYRQYKKLAERYRYRVYAIDFTTVPLEKCLENNSNRKHTTRYVPEDVIKMMYARFETQSLSKAVRNIKPDEIDSILNTNCIDCNSWNAINHIGDLHGCYTALKEYWDKYYCEDELFIFVGDLVDRGIENAKTVQFCIDIMNKSNVLFIEGNHEIHLWNWATNVPVKSHEFKHNTQVDLEKCSISKSSVRQLYRKMLQCSYYSFNNKKILVTHGGLSNIPSNDNLVKIATKQIIKGVGNYETDIDKVWQDNNPEVIQIHGHRNLFKHKIDEYPSSINLEGKIEFGGHLRIAQLKNNEIIPLEIKNNVFKVVNSPNTSSTPVTINQEFVAELKRNKGIECKYLSDNLISYKFKRKVFNKGSWDATNIKARGLFLTTSGKIAARSYDKFFNIGERIETKIENLERSLKFPLTIYKKYNGFLGLVSSHPDTDEIIITSKSTNEGPFKENFERILNTYDKEVLNIIRENAKKLKSTFVFEVIDPNNDPHMIEYDKEQVILLNVIHNTPKYHSLTYTEMLDLNIKLPCKELVKKIETWHDFLEWHYQVSTDKTIKEEGYVIEDINNYMVKIKLPYYKFWKSMRTVKERLASKRNKINKSMLYNEESNKFYNWLINCNYPKEKLKEMNIIELRNRFYNSLQEN